MASDLGPKTYMASLPRILAQTCVLALMVISTTQSVTAQQERCAVALIQNVGHLDLRDAQSLAQAETVYRSMNRDKDWSSHIGVDIVGVPANGGADYAEKERARFFRESNLDWTGERLVSVSTQRLGRNAVDAYRACIEGQQESGPRILVHDASEETATVTVRWLAGVGQDGPGDAEFDIIGARFRGRLPERFLNNESRSFIIERDPGRDIRIVANIGGGQDNVFVSRWPVAPPAKRQTLVIAACTGHGGQEGVTLWGPRGASCNGLTPPTWGFYDRSPRRATALGSCKGHGGFDGVTLWGPPGEPCGGIATWGIYEGAVPITSKGIANCSGHGDKLKGHRLWGPTGETCAGFPEWGTYSEAQILHNTEE